MKISNGLFILFVLLLATLALGTTAQAQLLNENFDYPAGDSLNVIHGWVVQPTASYVNTIRVASPGLTYTGYPSSGIGNCALVDTTGQDIYHSFTGQTSGSVYAAFLANITKATTAGEYFFHFTQATTTNFRGRVFARLSGSDVQFGLLKGSAGTPAYTTTTYAANTTHLIVLKYTFNTGTTTDDSVYLWINPTIGAPESTPDLSYGSTDADFATLSAVNLRQGSAANAPREFVDGIRVGTSWGLVVNGVPQPLSGSYSIPGDYATIAAAITDLNTLGVGPGGVTFNIAADYTESVTAPLLITATGTSGNPIVFQKSGVGANPVVTRTDAGSLVTTTLGGQGDAVIILQGSDYVTFDAINVAASDQGVEYGYFLRKASPTDGCKNVTIKNAAVTMTKGTSPYVVGIYSSNLDLASLVSDAAGITVTSIGGRNENVTLTGNTISNVFTGILLRGFAALTPYDFYDQNFVVGATGAANTIQNFAGNAVATAYGVYIIYHNNLSVSYNAINNLTGGGTGATSILYGIFNAAGTTSSFTANNNTIDLTTSATTSALYGINNAATGNLAINNNSVALNATVATSGVFGYIYNSSAAASTTITINNNTFVGTTYTTTGSTYLIYNNASQLTPGITTVSGNSLSGALNRAGASGTLYGYYNNGSPTGTENIFNNTYSGITLAGTSAFYGILSTTGSAHTHNVYNNVVSNITGGTGTMYGIHLTLATRTVYNNSVFGLVGGGIIYGISNGSGNASIYKNKVYNLSSTSTSTTAGTVTGIYISASTNTYIFNNFISDLRAATSAATDAIRGIGSISASTSSTIGVYYNTIFLNATSSGTNFGTSGIFHTTSTTATTAALDMRNNVVVNNSTPAGTGLTVAYRRSSAVLTNYANASNNNGLYAGTPGISNLVFHDGTTGDQTIAAFKTRVGPRDASSFTENTPFVNSTTTPYDLHMRTDVATQTEGGGTPITTPLAITADFDGDTRNVTTPDVGADEFAGIPLDLNPPVIAYTPLGNTGLTTARTLTATITDPSGVPTSGLGLPVLYWMINSGSYSAATATSLGSNQYQFGFGSGVAIGDTVRYYIAAQDGATPPNVGVQPSAGAAGFTANPPAASTPPTTPSSYLITNPALSGNYTVGLTLFNKVAGKNITFEKSVRKVMKEIVVEIPSNSQPAQKGAPLPEASTSVSHQASGTTQLVEVEEVTWIPMENGKVYEGNLYVKRDENPNLRWPAEINGIYPTITAAVADLNLRGVSGNTNFLLVDTAYPTETFPITVNIASSSVPSASSIVTIKPNTGVTAAVSGAAASTQIFKILNSYVNIDGSNSGGSTRDLTIENTSATTPQVIVIGSLGTIPTTNCSVKNCNIINGINSSSALIVSDGTAPATAGWFNNITIQNNTIQKAYIANYNIAVVSPGNGTGLNIIGNDLSTSGANSVRLVGVYVQGVDGATVSNNSIGNFTTLDASNITGIWFATGTANSTISNNTIGPISSTTGAPRGIAVSSAVANANVQLVGNTVSGIATAYSSAPYGIYVFSTTTGVTVARNKVSSIYNTNTGGYGARAIHVNTGLAASNITVKNNFVWDVKATSDNSITYWGIGIGVEGATGGVGVYYNSVNLYGSLSGYASTLGTIHTAFGVLTSTAGPLDVRDNIFVNTFDNTIQTIDKSYAINSLAPNTAFTNINNNDYFVGGLAGVLGYLGGDQTTLAAWRTATGRDTNSVSGTPFFRDSTDLHIDSTQIPLVVSNAGTPIAGITNDIDGQVRDVSTPDIGADEFALATVALSGTYTVGTGGQFATIADAFTALQNFGVAGPVTLLLTNSEYDLSRSGNLRDGRVAPPRARGMVDPLDPMYKGGTPAVQTDNPDTVGSLILTGPIAGASNTNRITIKPATGTSVTINSNGATALGLLNASYVTIDGVGLTGSTQLTINSTALGSIGVLFEGNADNNILQNVKVRAPFSNSTTVYLYADSATATPDNNVIQNNIIASGTDGVVILGNATSFPDANWISNNMIGTATDSIGETGVYVQQAFNTRINGNIIQNVRQVFTNVAGIWVATKHLGTQIWDNVIYNVKISPTTTAAGFASGMYLFGTSTDTTNGNYYNNMVYDLDYLGTFTGGTVRGMYVSTGRLDTIAYNSIYLTGTATTNVTSGALYTSTHIGQVFRNNIAINARTETGTGRAMAFYKLSTTSTISSNYNDLYVPTQPLSFIAGVGAANDTTLAQWRARGYDSMSVSTTANFQAPYLHINSTLPTPLDGGGTPIVGITTDFDGETRNATTPDIGADEFVVGVFPPPAITLVARSTRVPNAGDTLAVTCTITDTVGIVTANLLYAVDSVAQTPIAMTRTSGTPQNGTYQGVLPGAVNLNGKRIEYQIQANSSSGQSTTTAVTANNSYFAGVSPMSLSGVKAIAPTRQNLYVNYYAKVTGIVSGPNFQAGNVNLSYYFQDAVGGLNLFFFSSAVPVLALGDSITVIGKIAQFRGTTEIIPDNATTDIVIAASGRTVVPIQLTLAELNANPELYESRIVRLTSLQRVRATPPWPPLGSNANISMYQTVITDTTIMFLDLDTEIPGSPEPTYPITVTGVAGQFTSSSAIYNNGYEIIPRYLTDFTTPSLVLVANPGPTNNSGAANWAMFFNLIAGPQGVTITEMTTSSTALANASYQVVVFTRSGNALGGPVGSGPGSSTAGWDSLGTVPVTQGPVGAGVSLPFAIPQIHMNAGDTVGVAIRFLGVGPRYFGTGTPPYETYSDANLTLVTGDSRTVPFTPTGSFFSSRALVGEIHYVITPVGVKEPGQEIPVAFALSQNYPNPFNPSTTLRYALPKDARVTLSIYNILGQRIATLKDEVQNVGYYDVVWNGRNDFGSQIASGVYFYRIEARPVDGGDTFTSIKKMLMLK